MKKEKINRSSKRLVIIISLSLALLAVLGAFSFAWIRNYIEVDDLEITTGKMLYNFKLYRVKDGEVEEIADFFDTDRQDDAEAGQSEATLRKNIDNAFIEIADYGNDGEEVFFVIEKDPNSIDFDVAISFDNDGLVEYDYIGQMNYWMGDDSSALEDAHDYAALETYLLNPGANPDPEPDGKNLGNIWNSIQKTSLSGTQTYACIRLKLERNDAVSAGFEGKNFPLKIEFAVAQKGALPDDMKVDRFEVEDHDSLQKAMQDYGFGDEIYITKSVEYTGDLVFTRPCTIVLLRSTLTVKGNVIFSYMYGGKFTLNTVSDGHIKIENNNNSAGNFRIDLPDTTIELLGANNDAEGKADIYVEGEFTANASKEEGEGIFFKGIRICNSRFNDGEYDYSTDLKPVFINGKTRISISNRTRVGALSTDFHCDKFVLENGGYIEKIDLSNMSLDTTLVKSPAILIDNAGTVGTVDRADGETPNEDEDDDIILLPEWSVKFKENDTTSAEDNTHIIANKGSGKILAITSNNSFEDSLEIVNSGKFFFSLGDKGESGYRDDIDYMLRTQFVEAVDGDKTNIIIHYETPAQIILNEAQYADLSELNNLATYISYYARNGEIAPVGELESVKIICYGTKALSADDYGAIKSMTALTTLDLSDAVSVNKWVPDNALNGIASLTSIKMSESDTVWGKNIFTGTGIDEITFPQALIRLDNTKNAAKQVSKQDVLDGIKYVYTSITKVDDLYLNVASTQYFFTPDQETYLMYREIYKNAYGYKYDSPNWNCKIFLNNGVIRYGEYFLRYDPKSTEINPTCEFVTFTGGTTSAWIEDAYNNYRFDFNKINIGGKTYKIISYDPYALYNKLIKEENLEIVISDNVKEIGEYAFACNDAPKNILGVRSITIESNPTINGYAFAYHDTLISFSAPELTTLTGGANLFGNSALKTIYMPKLSAVEGNYAISNCESLERVDIGVIKKDENNSYFYAAIEQDGKGGYINNGTLYDTYSYTKFYIHTKNAQRLEESDKALAADYRYIFVTGTNKFDEFYKKTDTYTGVVDMGDNDLDDLISADINGNDLDIGEELAYYYVIDGSEAHLVACMLSEIDETGNDYTTIDSFNHEGVDYPVTKIGSAAYHFTSMIAQNIKISDDVDKLGNHAFNSEKQSLKKYCINLDLNNVVSAGKGAFYYMSMVKITGNNLVTVGKDTLSYNQNLMIAYLPNLSSSKMEDENDNTIYQVFEKCSNLRIIYVGFSENIAYNDTDATMKNYIRFINFVGGPERITVAKVNTVINSGLPTVDLSFTNNFINTDSSFTGIYLSDYYEYTVNIKGMIETIELPGYIYHNKGNGEVSLIAVSPDIQTQHFGDFKTNANGGTDYITPGRLYLDNGRYTSMDNGTTPLFNVTSIGKYAYGATSVAGIDNFIIADSVEKMDAGALKGSAYVSSSVTIKPLQNVNTVDFSNVVEIGTDTCNGGNIKQIKALNLKVVGDMAFANCKSLEKVYLPAFEEALGTYTFRYCTSLKEATFGKNATTFVSDMFDNCSALQKITILNSTSVVKIGSSLVSLTYANAVSVSVPKAIYATYKSTFASGFGNIPVDNFQFFGSSSEIDGILYYWNIIDETSKTAYIDYIEGDLSSIITLPSTLDGYTIIAVSADAMSALSGVTKVILPDSMEYLTFTTADIAETVAELEIAASNTKFKTVNGVLYSWDGVNVHTLLVYPMAKNAEIYVVESGTTEIAYRAFYGTKFLKTLMINDVVTVRDQAFEATKINMIKFTNTTASIFAGRDILLNANVNLKIKVPGTVLSAYRNNVLIDYSIVTDNKIIAS